MTAHSQDAPDAPAAHSLLAARDTRVLARLRPEPWAHPPGRAVPAAHLALWAAQRRREPAS